MASMEFTVTVSVEAVDGLPDTLRMSVGISGGTMPHKIDQFVSGHDVNRLDAEPPALLRQALFDLCRATPPAIHTDAVSLIPEMQSHERHRPHAYMDRVVGTISAPPSE